MKVIRTDTRCDFRFQISDSRLGLEASEQVFSRFQTCDVFEIAEKVGVKIVYQKWFPVTLGEFDWGTKTVFVNENAPISFEKIVAHELGHYFLREFNVKDIVDEEKFCDEFADEILKKFRAKPQSLQR
jgi:Zn-dependent peptidase ImmA (M78 family)